MPKFLSKLNLSDLDNKQKYIICKKAVSELITVHKLIMVQLYFEHLRFVEV